MRIRRRAATEEAEGLRGGDLMPRVGWNQDGIAGGDVASFTVDLHGALPFEDEVELFAELVVMTLGWLADGDGGLGKTLILH